MKNIFLKIGLILGFFAIVISCESQDDYTGESTQTANSPALSVTLDFLNSETLVEAEKSYNFTVNISEAQIANVSVKLSQTGGTATRGSDFDFPSSITIPIGQTSASGVISIMSDDIIEDVEDVEITIATGSEANVGSVSSQVVTFNIQNLVEGDLMVGLSWEASSLTTDNGGNEIDPTDLADLRLLITDVPYTTILGGADGASFESYTLTSSSDDGEYYVVADFYAAMDIPADLNLTVTFDQTGVINGSSQTFPAALNTSNSCSSVHYILAKITKSGDNYTIEELGEASEFPSESWSGTDSGYPSEVTTTFDCEGTLVFGLNAEWMLDFWGEVIEEEGKVYYTVDGAGVVTIPEQFVFTTSFDGSLYDYTVSGTGVLDLNAGTLNLQYYLDQDGFSPSNWAFDNGYQTTPYFEAILTN